MLRRRQSGFTLIELMVVVVIVAILAAIALPAFSGYVKKSRANEAPTFLGEIKARQESYRAEFGQYCDAGGGAFGNWAPRNTPDSRQTGWGVPAGSGWEMLGAAPDGPVRFVYSTPAGLPPSLPPVALGGYTGMEFWYVAQARGDLDDDGMEVTFEAYSLTHQIWCSEAKGWE